jgi:hypothetical protein
MKFLEIGLQFFRDLMKSFGASSGTQTRVPGKNQVPTKESIYPGKQSYKKKPSPVHTKGRGRRH